MESLAYGLILKKKKKNKNNNNNNNNISDVNEIKDNNDNKYINNTNEIILKCNSLLIKSEMDKNGFYPKTKYSINNNKNNVDDKFPEKFNFEKIFPNLTSYFKNLDNNFSFSIENINNNNKYKKKEMPKMLK